MFRAHTHRMRPKHVCAVRMVHGTIRTAHTTYTAALKTTTHPKTRCRKPYAATQHLMLLMIGRMYPKHVDLRIHH